MTDDYALESRDGPLIEHFAERASRLWARFNGKTVDPHWIASEVSLVHNHIVPLRLQELLDADDGNFAHDIVGIHCHLAGDNPSDGFKPRFAKGESDVWRQRVLNARRKR